MAPALILLSFALSAAAACGMISVGSEQTADAGRIGPTHPAPSE